MVLTENLQFRKFIILTMILPCPHDSAIRWREDLGVLWEAPLLDDLRALVEFAQAGSIAGAEASRKLMPIDEDVAHDLLAWYEVTPYKKPSDYVWATDANRAGSKRGKQPEIGRAHV